MSSTLGKQPAHLPVDADVSDHPLDNAPWSALTGPQAGLAQRRGAAVRCLPDVAPFAALPDPADDDAWRDLAELLGPGGFAVLAGPPRTPPPGWEVEAQIDGVQMEGSGMAVMGASDAVVLGADDVPEMLDLVRRTEPGPFLPRTRELGAYLGIRRDGALVAMAGERMRPPGWSEISAVCTDPAFRGLGLASVLVRAVGAVIRERGDVPFLHASATNTGAIALYQRLGMTIRSRPQFTALRRPAPPVPVPAGQ